MKKIPDNIKNAIDLYVETGRPAGSFTMGVLANDLTKAVQHADPTSLAHLREIVGYCVWDIPSNCWGSHEKVKEWIESKKKIREATDE